jgi:hypothetical protein
MLKFVMKKFTPVIPEPHSGQSKAGWELFAKDQWLTDVWQERIGGNWQFVDKLACRNMSAASRLHALELGILSSARWIAVELEKAPGPLPAGEARVYGVGLDLLPRGSGSYGLRLAHDLKREDLGAVGDNGAPWIAVGPYLQVMAPKPCASREQALTALIEHAAPWIAAALDEELEKP